MGEKEKSSASGGDMLSTVDLEGDGDKMEAVDMDYDEEDAGNSFKVSGPFNQCNRLHALRTCTNGVTPVWLGIFRPQAQTPPSPPGCNFNITDFSICAY